jgi:hypothetical protein
VDHLARGLQVGALAEIVAAEADERNAQAGAAEITNLLGSFLLNRARRKYRRGEARAKRSRIVIRAPPRHKVRGVMALMCVKFRPMPASGPLRRRSNASE